MIKFVRGKITAMLRYDFIRFCMVGGLGFLINILLLILFRRLFGFPIFVSQFLGAEVALFSNFVLHQQWTYKNNKNDKSLSSLLVQFHLTSWPAILGSSFMVSFGASTLHFNSFTALVVSSIVVLGWNYFWSKFVIWKNITNKEVMELSK